MIATIVSPGSIPEFVHPPVPGESHELYGDNHLDSIKLPVSVTRRSPGGSAQSRVIQSADPLGVESSFLSSRTNETSAPSSSSRSDTAREPTSGATPVVNQDSIEGSSDDILWARLVENCINGQADFVQEILTLSPQLKESIDNVSTATGMNPLHFAASRGHEEIVRILIDQAGAGVDAPDREGETALLKASYSGCYSVVCFLLKRGANVHQRDKDGWTALHNASSKGFIDIAQALLEKGEADINARSKMGHTPLINAASKGDVPMVLYYLNHARANPLLKNTFSEMAYDVAAANSEAYLCDILQSSEKQWWKEERQGDQPYEPLAIHSTVLLTVHENQRASSSFPLSLMTPKFSAGALTQQDVCGPWSLPNGRPSTKDDVHLPLAPSTMSRSNMQRGWFWLTEWMIDKTDPNVDSEGWQYGKSLVESNQQWTAIPPTSGGNWVRRRKWIRVMKKRLDLITSPGDTAENIEDGQPSFGQEMAGNYTKRANLALRLNDGFTDKVQELQRYSQAIQILLYGIKVDMDPSTKQTASILVTQYLLRAEELKDAIRQREAAYEYLHRLDMPRLQAGNADGSGSGSELLTLNLQKSRPYDLETTNDLLHSQHEDDDPDDQSECVSEGSFSSALDGDGQDHAQDNESRATLDQYRSTDDDVELLLSELTTQDGDSPSVDPDGHRSTLTQPIPVSNHQVPTVAVLSASPAAGQSDSFPVARLTRISRPEISQSSSSRSITDTISSSPSTVSSGLSRRAESSSMATRASSSSPTSARHPSSFYSPPGRINQDRTTFGIRPTQSSVQPQLPTVTEAKWELDHKAIECRECHRKFSLWLRRHHCRRCGHVVCDRCSSQRAMLPPDRVVYDPTSSEAYLNHQALLRKGTIQSYRVCDSCYATMEPIRSHSLSGASGNGSGSNSMYSSSGTLPQAHRPIYGQTSSHSVSQASSAPVQSDRSMGMFAQGSAYSQNQQSHTSSRSSSSSNLHPAPMVRSASSGSLMSECPVCGIILAGLEGGKTAQETHVQDCLEGKSGNGAGPPVRYIMYKLAADSPLIDQECAICFEEFVAGRTVARLNCLCTYHRHCIHSWLQHGSSCPVHYR